MVIAIINLFSRIWRLIGLLFKFSITYVMEEKMNNEELQNRREFFKKAAKGVLPILGLLFMPQTISSVQAYTKTPGNCYYGCATSCFAFCITACSMSCSLSCEYSCTETCKLTCQGSCQNGCQGNCLYGCKNTCKTTCKGTVKRGTSSNNNGIYYNRSNGSSYSGCTGCSAACAQTCSSTCTGHCYGQCGSACSNSCSGSCKGGCTGYSGG